MPNGVSGRFSPLANSQARAAHTPVHTPAPTSVSTPRSRPPRTCSPALQGGAQREGRPVSALPAPKSPPHGFEPRPFRSPSPPPAPRPGRHGVPHSTGGAGGTEVGKKSPGSHELRWLFRSCDRVWLPGEAPCLKFGGASGGLLPALGCGVRLANWKDTRALREPPGTPPRAHSTLSERAPLLPARPRPAPHQAHLHTLLAPGFPEHLGSLATCAEKRRPRGECAGNPCSAETKFWRSDLSKGILLNFCLFLVFRVLNVAAVSVHSS